MKQEIKTRQCPGCKVILPYQERLSHLESSQQYGSATFGRYGVASPECLALYNQILMNEYMFGRPMCARLDAYGVQHPPHPEIQKQLEVEGRYIAASKQSVAIHLIALYLMIEKKMPLEAVSTVMGRILSSDKQVKLENEELISPANLGTLTVADVVKATTPEEHTELVWKWSRSAWDAWKSYHHKVQEWYEKYGK